MKNPGSNRANRVKKAEVFRRPVSQKFYDDISRRVAYALMAHSHHDTEQLIGGMMRMLDEYMAHGTVPTRAAGIDAVMVFALLRPEIDRAITRSKRARESAARRREAKAAALIEQPPVVDEVKSESAVGSISGGLHGEACGLLKSEKEVHGVDRVAGTAFEQVVDDGCDQQFAVDLVQMDDTLVGVDDVLEVGDLRGDEREVVVGEIVAVNLDDLREVKRAVEVADSHDAARE